ncbi:MAG: CPBP family intramembrane glutamic endopeptidase [Chloroflexota bacterium]
MAEEIGHDAPGARGVPWTVGDVVKGIVLVVGVTFVIAMGLAFGTVLLVGLEPLVGQGATHMRGLLEVLSARGLLTPWLLLLLVGAVMGEVAMPVSAWLFSGLKYRVGWRALGFRPFKVTKGLMLAGVVVVAGLVISVLNDMLLGWLGMEAPTGWPAELTESGLGLAIAALLAIVVAPVAEEAFFRGFVLAGIGGRVGYGWGVVLSAVLFTVAHMQPLAFLPVFILGLLLGWLYVKTGSIWPCVLTHLAYNSIALAFMV